MQWRVGAAVRVLGQPFAPCLHVALRPFQRLMPRHHRCKWTTLVMRKPVAGPAIRVLTKVRCRSRSIMFRPRSVAHRRGRNGKTITYRRRILGDSAVASRSLASCSTSEAACSIKSLRAIVSSHGPSWRVFRPTTIEDIRNRNPEADQRCAGRTRRVHPGQRLHTD